MEEMEGGGRTLFLGHVHPPSLLPLKAHVLHISISIDMRNIRLRVHSTFYTAALSFKL